MKPPLFLSLEGLDGAGKSTHLAWLTQWLDSHQINPLITREPGGTPLGERLREILLHEPMHADTEALLMFAARREHLAAVIEPALAAGRWVVSDRFTDASYAYQCGGRGLSFERLQQLENWVQGRADGLLQPHLTLLFDVTPEVSQARLAGAREPDRFERERADFFVKVRAAYHARAKADPERIKIIDSTRSFEAIQQELERVMQDALRRFSW
ncbi:dTMP kinase [Parachitinimonas caeni]|uniref:Thymidylate kinase n=1 Tax=Parachitinimonas caeni TaxID=3031301 RepID=A0ABT7DUX5_9NEIS|nr:dTMP kinase [Parachitinimonas caeni]MDK2123876.1 dTMP kinase [Parachitinimonas caeni]